jgi:hypothetical protein
MIDMHSVHLVVALSLILTLSASLASEEIGFARAIYGPWNYSQDARVGLDADYDNKWWTTGPERVLESFRSNSLTAAASNVTYVAGLYYLGDEADFEYVRAVNEAGQEQSHVPSTVDRAYWLKIIEEPALAVANLSLHYPIWGLVWDFELYLAEDGWETDSYSYDAPALRDYARARGVQIPELSADQRYGWLRSSGLLGDFMDWQEEVAYEMARETKEKVHGINPNLSLGILGFSDSWRYWATLKGFSGDLPITLWTEDTYGGYEEERVEYLRNRTRMMGLNCRVLPGLYTVALSPWRMIEDMERATRHNGAFWIYQHDGDQYHLADEWTYSRAYEIFNRFIFFNRSRAEPLPSFYLHPGVVARPYVGPDGISVLLEPEPGLDPGDEVVLITDADHLDYVSTNLSLRELSSNELSARNLPCIVHGLHHGDLPAIEAWSLLRELSSLLDAYDGLGLSEMGDLDSMLEHALSDFEAGRYGEVQGTLAPVSDRGYHQILDVVYPLVQEAMRNPRESDIPLESMREVSYASDLYQDGRIAKGNTHLIRGLSYWSQAVSEDGAWVFLISLLALILLRHRLRPDFHR